MMSTQIQLGQPSIENTDIAGLYGFELIDYEETKDSTDGTQNALESGEDLVGCRIEFQWTSGKWYRGTICEFNNEKRLHFVQYDDGEEKWYYLPEMVYRFVKDEEEGWIKC